MSLLTYFLVAWRSTGRDEGGYVDHPADSGGPTKYGITQAVARVHGYEGDMRELTQERAREIGKAQYWDLMQLDAIAAINPPIAYELFDTGFLCGHARTAQWLQRCLNCGNRLARDYPDLEADGLIGPITIDALRIFLRLRGTDGERVLLNALNGLQSAHFTQLTEARAKDEAFWFGWQLKRVRF